MLTNRRCSSIEVVEYLACIVTAGAIVRGLVLHFLTSALDGCHDEANTISRAG
jgi:hypothetical protein